MKLVSNKSFLLSRIILSFDDMREKVPHFDTRAVHWAIWLTVAGRVLLHDVPLEFFRWNHTYIGFDPYYPVGKRDVIEWYLTKTASGLANQDEPPDILPRVRYATSKDAP